MLAATLRLAARSRAGALSVRALAAAIEVARADHPIGQSDLRAILGATDMQASRAIGMATRHGLIRREQQHAGDRRRVLLHATPDSRFLLTLLTRDRAP